MNENEKKITPDESENEPERKRDIASQDTDGTADGGDGFPLSQSECDTEQNVSDTQAFKWEWTSDSENERSSGTDGCYKEQDVDGDGLDTARGDDVGSEDMSRDDVARDGEESTNDTQAHHAEESTNDTQAPHAESFDGEGFRYGGGCGDVPKGNKEKKKKRNGSPYTTTAIVLSSCAITLLVAILFFATFFGMINGGNVVYVPIASDGTYEETDSATSSDMLEEVMSSVVVIKAQTVTGSSIGTGIIMSSNGYIITNYHIIEGASKVYAYLYGGEKPLVALVVGYREIDDVAILKIAADGLRAATFAKSSECRVGQKVYAIGTPEGDEFGWSVSQGIISSPNRQIKIYDDEGVLSKKMNVIQTDASVNPGNSGGPLINSKGEVVGIITLKLSDSAGMGFAIPSDGVLKDAEAIIKNGHANDVDSGISTGRPIIGITGVGVQGGYWYENVVTGGASAVRVVSEEYAKENPDNTFYASNSGVYVSATSKGYDAAQKLKVGDVICSVNGVDVYTIYQVMAIVNDLDGGDTITVKYYRNNTRGECEIVLGIQSK